MGLIVLGAALRFSTLGARSFWLDEALTVDILEEGFTGMLSRLDENGGGGPVYFLLAWPWTQLFGTSEVGLRSLSALIGTATVPVAYWAAREVASHRVATIAAALAATSPLLVWQAQEARPYALLILMGGASFALFVRARREPEGGAPAAWAVISALLVATHYVAVFMLVVEAALLLRANTGRRVRAAVLGVAVATAMLIPLVLAGREHGLGSLPDTAGPARRLFVLPAEFLAGYQPPLQILTPVAAALLGIVAALLLARRATAAERRSAGLAIGLVAAVVLLAMLASVSGSDLVLTRYLSELWIPAAVVAALGFGTAAAGRLGALAATALCVLFAAVAITTAWEPKFDRDDWRGAAGAVGGAPVPRAIVVSPGRGPEAFAHYRPRARLMTGSQTVVREIAFVVLPSAVQGIGEKPEPPPRDPVTAPPAGFVLVEDRRDEFFTFQRFRAQRALPVTVDALVGAIPGPPVAIFLEGAG